MKTLVCAIGRLENHYIREWVEWYKNIGFSNICLYDNNRNNEEHFEDVIDDYIKSGYVILQNYRDRKNCQLQAYNDCYKQYGNTYDWIAFFDCDEYLDIHNGLKIDDILSKEFYDEFDAVCPCWRNYDDNNLVEVNHNYSISRFTHPNGKDEGVIKSILRGGLLNVNFLNEGGNPHAPWKCGLNGCNTKGEMIDYENPSGYFIGNKYTLEYMALNHYRYKTIEEFVTKALRGYPDGNYAPINLYEFSNYNDITPEKILKYRELLFPHISGLTSAVCCIAKNENKYINEWVKHYRGLDFDKIFIYDNNDLNGEHLEDELQSFIDSGFVEIVNYRGKKNCQLLAYQDCYDKNKDKYNWIAFFDCDEYLHLTKGNTMRTYMISNFLENKDMIHVNWVLYGDNDKLSIEKNKLQETLPNCLPLDLKTIYDFPQNNHIKSIIRGIGNTNKIYWGRTPHTPINFKGKCCNPNGIIVNSDSPFTKASINVAYLSHYQFKTVDDIVKKLERGYPDQTIGDINEWVHKQIAEFFICNRKKQEKIDILNKWIDSYNMSHNNKINKIPNMEKPLVSIIMPCYNMEKYVADAIASIKEQTYENIECIIVNDGSTDNSENVILDNIRNDKRFKYIYQFNAGVCTARNTAAKLANGKYLLSFDPDDILMNYYIKSAVDIMEADSSISVIAPNAIWFGTVGAKSLALKYTDYAEELKHNCIMNSSMMKKEEFDAIGGYNIKSTRSEDWDLWIRLLYKDKKVYRYNEIGYLYRSTGNGRGAEESKNATATLEEIVANNKEIYQEFGLGIVTTKKEQ